MNLLIAKGKMKIMTHILRILLLILTTMKCAQVMCTTQIYYFHHSLMKWRSHAIFLIQVESDKNPDINKNIQDTSNVEFTGELSNENDKYEDDANDIQHDNNDLNSTEIKTVKNSVDQHNVDANDKEMVMIHLYDTNGLPSTFVEKIQIDIDMQTISQKHAVQPILK